RPNHASSWRFLKVQRLVSAVMDMGSRTASAVPHLPKRGWTRGQFRCGCQCRNGDVEMNAKRTNQVWDPLADSRQDKLRADRQPRTPQSESPAYRLAYVDEDFLCREELRPIRLQLELLKPELLLME